MKNENTVKASSGGIGFFGLLTIVFIVLKLTGVIDWAWIWVLAPLWGSIILGIAFAIVFFVFYFLFCVVKALIDTNW